MCCLKCVHFIFSVAILRYLCREYNVADHWYSKDSVKQARVDEYLEWQHLNTRLYCAMYFRIKFIIPLMSGNPPKQSLLDIYFKGMEDTCDIIENIWLKGKNFLCGDEISIADLIGICELEQPRMAGYDPRKGRPLIEDWMTRVKNHLNPHYDIINIRLEKIISIYKGIPPMVSKI
uniref:GST C-terminal domain-containing protein n=1 Tax=Clastoptera arizonana TaxID=38151 RepID=A0A1B6CIJ9_9HEMI